MPDPTESTVNVKIEAGSLSIGLCAIAVAIGAPLHCNPEARCERWADTATSVQDRIDRYAQCEAEEAAR